MTLSADSTQGGGRPPPVQLDRLRSTHSTSRLNQIEKVRANGAGELVSLPQLVVCGDQSAGKSSVLEGITGIPFPRQEGLCTRFPTEIILRHCETSTSRTIVASIHPHTSRDETTRNALLKFRREADDLSELPSIVQEVAKLMKIRGSGDRDSDTVSFASDALRIEISGPLGLHLSVVDLPGLIAVASEDQEDDDVEAVRDMVTSYIQSSRSIILAVLQASNDMANQGIIKLARKSDPEGRRTVGIITKPDLINAGSEDKIILAVNNQDTIKLKLGFFVLKNPSPSELAEGLTMETRSSRELRFFQALVWANQKLDMNRVGAERLRQFLQELLDKHIETELPKVREEIRKSLATTETELMSLGDARLDVTRIRSFMTNLSMQFYELVQAALDGSYLASDAQFFSESTSSRLRAGIQNTNTIYSSYMRISGQKRKFKEDWEFEVPPGEDPKSSSSQTTEEDSNGPIEVTGQEMKAWIKQVYLRTRGRELPGNYNPQLLSELFQEQSSRWYDIAYDHVQAILVIVWQWVEKAVEQIVLEDRLQNEVREILRAWKDEAERRALQELARLVEDERRAPLTYNHYYTDNVQKARVDKKKAGLRHAIEQVMTEDRHGKLHIPNLASDINYFISSIQSKVIVDMDEQACEEARTQLDSYYKVARKTFVDNVARQVIERHIVATLSDAFCPKSIANLSDEDLLRIGSEPAQQIERRNKLGLQAEGLRKSLRELQRPVG